MWLPLEAVAVPFVARHARAGGGVSCESEKTPDLFSPLLLPFPVHKKTVVREAYPTEERS